MRASSGMRGSVDFSGKRLMVEVDGDGGCEDGSDGGGDSGNMYNDEFCICHDDERE